MKHIFLILVVLLIFPMTSSAEKMYVFVDKIGMQEDGKIGQTAVGDVVEAVPYTAQFTPTSAERDRYHIFVVDMTTEEANAVLAPQVDFKNKITKTRRLNLDYETLKNYEQETEIPNATLFNNVLDNAIGSRITVTE